MWRTFIGAFLGALAALFAFFGVAAALAWRWANTPLGEKLNLTTPTPAGIELMPVNESVYSLLDPGYVWLWVVLFAIFALLVIWMILEVRGIRKKK